MEEANQGEKNMVPDKISNFLILLAFHMITYISLKMNSWKILQVERTQLLKKFLD